MAGRDLGARGLGIWGGRASFVPLYHYPVCEEDSSHARLCGRVAAASASRRI
jgi:hypothetical protein